MTNTPLRFCLFGAGGMAGIHADNLVALPGVQFSYVVDPDAARAETLASRCGARVVDQETAFADTELSGYLIASPPRTHADYLVRAVETGAYVFCEKPIDHDLDRILAVLDRIEAGRDRVQMGFNRRFDADFRALKQTIADGQIGAVEQVLIISRDPQAPTVEAFRTSSGLLKETTIHDFDTARWLLEEEPVDVYVNGGAVIDPAYESVGQIDTATTTMRMASGRQVTIVNSLRAAFGYDQRIEVLGAEGMAQAGNMARNRVTVARADGFRTERLEWFFPERYREAYRTEIADFVSAVRENKKVTPNAYDGYRASLISDAALESLASGRRVTIRS